MKTDLLKKGITGIVFLVLGVYGGHFLADAGVLPGWSDAAEKKSVSRRPPQSGKKVIQETDNDNSLTDEEKKIRDAMEDLNKRLESGLTLSQMREELAKMKSLGEEGIWGIHMILRKMAEQEPREAIEYLDKTGDIRKNRKIWLMQELVGIWCKKNPEEMARYYSGNREGLYSGYMASTISREWAKTSPGEALTWLSSLSQKEQRSAIPAFLESIVSDKPGELTHYLDKINPEALEMYEKKQLVEKWAGQDWEAAEKWVDSLPDSEKKYVSEALYSYLALNNLGEFERRLETLPKEDKNRIVQSLADVMVINKGFSGTMDWLQENGDFTRDNNSGVYQLIYRWTRDDPQEARDYLRELPEGKFRDAAINSYAQNSPSPNYKETLDLLNNMGDKNQKNSTASYIVQRWAQDNPEQAKDWVEKSDFTKERKEEMIKRMEEKD